MTPDVPSSGALGAFVVRDATVNDIDTVLHLGKAFHGSSPSYRDFHYDSEHTRRFLERFVEDSQNALFLVAEIQSEAVGFFVGTLAPIVFVSRAMSVQNLAYITDEHRHSGIADAFVRRFIKWSDQREVLYMDFPDTSAVPDVSIAGLVEKHGFKRVGANYRRVGAFA